MKNIDNDVVHSFGEEWNYYKQNNSDNLTPAFKQYFDIFPDKFLNDQNVGFDMGCGSGRWAKFIAPKIKILNCIEPSKKALKVAKQNLRGFNNCIFENASTNSNSLKKESQDFGYCLGVLHHIPDPQVGLNSCVSKLKKGSPLLTYLYYKFDNRPKWYFIIWYLTVLPRKLISLLPFQIKLLISKLIALFIYLPFDNFGIKLRDLPLYDYRNKSFYFMQTDAFDRFATKIEKRFTKNEIIQMMHHAGLENLKFSNKAPFWVCIGYKK